MEIEQNSAALTETTPRGPLTVGERVEGQLAEIDAGGARLALADGRSVSIALSEVSGDGIVQLGETVSAFVVRVDAGGDVWVSRTKGSAVVLLLLNARDNDQEVEGRVAAQGPRGLEIDLGGGIFAVCPPAEIGSDVDNPGHLVGQTVQFKVKEATEAKIVLSRKDAAQVASRDGGTTDAQVEEAADVRRRLRPGAIMAGRITRIREFGAFVDLGGGVEGLIHLSELAHERLSSPKEVVQPGQPVEVQVLKVDYDAHKGERISLSLKALAKSAWDRLTGRSQGGCEAFRQGDARRALRRLRRALTRRERAHSRERHGRKAPCPAHEVLKVDDEVEVEVVGVDQEKHRISLKRIPSSEETAERRAAQAAMREQKKAEARQKREEARQKPHERLKPGDIVDGVVDRIEPYGFFLQLKWGGRGMVHVSEMGSAPEGADPQKPVAEQFPKGTKIKVAVLEIDPEHRIRLSRAAVPELEKGTAPETYLKHKSQHELEEKLLRSASKPPKPAAEPRRMRPDGRRPEGRQRPAPATAQAQAQADGSERQPRRERPPKQRPVGIGKPEKSGGLGTLGDLLKVKLQQRKN